MPAQRHSPHLVHHDSRADHLFRLQQWDPVLELILKFAARTLGSAPTEHRHAIETVNTPLEEPAADDDASESVDGWDAAIAGQAPMGALTMPVSSCAGRREDATRARWDRRSCGAKESVNRWNSRPGGSGSQPP